MLVGIRSLLDSSEESAATALRLAIEDNAVLPCGGLIVGAGAAAMETFLANRWSPAWVAGSDALHIRPRHQ
ncbi:hypothetical protein BOSEA1005_30496 [Hyphomicrobiales bacterium]|nr:hypothetical protein BOSEA1005_30496 [Hyphomicrobiales bacterium]